MKSLKPWLVVLSFTPLALVFFLGYMVFWALPIIAYNFVREFWIPILCGVLLWGALWLTGQ